MQRDPMAHEDCRGGPVTDIKRLAIRVLVADDEAEVRDAYRQILRRSRYERRNRGVSQSAGPALHETRRGSGGEEALGAQYRISRRSFAKARKRRSPRFATRSPRTIRSRWHSSTCACRRGRMACGRRRAFANSIRPSKSSCARRTPTSIRARWAPSCRPRKSSRTCKSRFIRTKFAR